MIDKNDELTIKTQCDLTGISRSGYYYKTQKESAENLELMNRIDELHLEHPTWGSRMLRDILRDEGYKVNRKRIQRLSGLMQIRTIYQSRNLSRRNLNHRIYPYLLRGVKVERVNQVWSTDITYIRMPDGWMYMTAIIDWHSRAILAWRLSNTCDRFFCIDALQEALEKFGNPEVFNTDQGATFTSPDFIKVLEEAGIAISMDGKGRALDNARIERFWRTLKYDEVYLKSYTDISDARKQIGEFVSVYNNIRPHSSLDGGKPMKIYIGLKDQFKESA